MSLKCEPHFIMSAFKRLCVTLSLGTPLCPYGISHRRVYASRLRVRWADYYQVDILCARYKFVNFGMGKSPAVGANTLRQSLRFMIERSYFL